MKRTVTDKATIHVKWVRSGIGFTRRQKGAVRSLGLRRLNQIVEREDTPQNRGLVASIPHMVEIVEKPAKSSAWTAIPEYVVHPKPAPPVEPPAVAPDEQTVVGAPSLVAVAASAEKAEAPRAKAAKPAKTEKATKATPAKGKAAKAGKEKEPEKKAKPAAKAEKPTKKGKK